MFYKNIFIHYLSILPVEPREFGLPLSLFCHRDHRARMLSMIFTQAVADAAKLSTHDASGALN